MKMGHQMFINMCSVSQTCHCAGVRFVDMHIPSGSYKAHAGLPFCFCVVVCFDLAADFDQVTNTSRSPRMCAASGDWQCGTHQQQSRSPAQLRTLACTRPICTANKLHSRYILPSSHAPHIPALHCTSCADLWIWAQEALPHMSQGGSITMISSVTAYK